MGLVKGYVPPLFLPCLWLVGKFVSVSMCWLLSC